MTGRTDCLLVDALYVLPPPRWRDAVMYDPLS